MRFLRLLLPLTIVALSAAALAQTAEKPAADKPTDAADKAPPKRDLGRKIVRRDPEGKTGVSPSMEQVLKGEQAFVNHDIPGALAAFQQAVKLDGSRMLPLYRLGEAQLASGKLEEAEASWQSALHKKGPPELKAKVLFVLADLRERQQKWVAAKEGWVAYQAHLQETKASGWPTTSADRQKQADRRIKDEKDYGAVKERIAKREAEKLKEAEDNAKKDKLNR